MATLSLRAYSLGSDRLYADQGLGAGLFCSAGYAHAGSYWGDCDGRSNMVLNLLFVVPLHFYWQVGHVGLALATSVSAF